MTMSANRTAQAIPTARVNQGLPDRGIVVGAGKVVGDFPAVFCGIQEGATPGTSFELYNLTRAVGLHPEGSTVTRETLERHGFKVPPGTKTPWPAPVAGGQKTVGGGRTV